MTAFLITGDPYSGKDKSAIKIVGDWRDIAIDKVRTGHVKLLWENIQIVSGICIAFQDTGDITADAIFDAHAGTCPDLEIARDRSRTAQAHVT